MTHAGHLRMTAVLAVIALALAGFGCGAGEPSPEAKAAVETKVRGYLDALARSYSTLDLSYLEGYASPAEVRNVRNLLQQLANSGDRVEATLVGLEFTGLDIFRNANTSVGLVEV